MSVVYVIELQDDSLYVGRTNLTREQRILNHMNGHKSARIVKKLGVKRQRDDLIPESWLKDLDYEMSHLGEKVVAHLLREDGYVVHGGH